ncbi:hypothetical protein M9H77_11785 [Catharanthus roseus]|uniref:Uncharacterized protein n=1 Tax=Catharanthus roseus TaxID=4058 RepID=A0ACC0BFK1_CATRO|nr:hypothetical protein M9H77_11785 [Catharanthus roseus]
MDWTRRHIIGQGSTATVSVATVWGGCDDGLGVEVFAVKSVELAKSEFLQKEQKILSILTSPHIVGYKGYDITREKNKLMFNLMMEYLPAGTLSDAIHKSGGRLKESMISYYTRQILQGLEYLHCNGIVHCDIKGRNILVSETDGAKIADFGCAKLANSAVVVGGTPMFMAPEVARGEEQGFAADIWALGCTIIEMATGCSPWPNSNNSTTNPASLIYKIGFSETLPQIPDFLSDQAKDFLKKCLKRDPNERWTAEQLLKHQFLSEISKEKKDHREELIQITTSPTSILDQGIWNSMEEELETTTFNGGIFIITENSSNNSLSPAKRLEQLSSKSGKSNWSFDDQSWITVRNEKVGEEAVVGGSLAGSVSHGMKVEISTVDENSEELFSIFLDDKNSISNNIISTELKFTNEISVISNLNFKRHKNKQMLNPIHFL